MGYQVGEEDCESLAIVSARIIYIFDQTILYL